MQIVLFIGFAIFISLQCCLSDNARLLYKILPGIICGAIGFSILISTLVGILIQFLAIKHVITGFLLGLTVSATGIFLFKLAISKKGL